MDEKLSKKLTRVLSGKFSRCKRCPLPKWRAQGLCMACVTLERDETGKWFINPNPKVTWDERPFKRRRWRRVSS